MLLIPRYQFLQHRARSNNDVSNSDIFTGSSIDIARGEHVLGASSLLDPISSLNVRSVGKEGPSKLPRPLFLTSVILQ